MRFARRGYRRRYRAGSSRGAAARRMRRPGASSKIEAMSVDDGTAVGSPTMRRLSLAGVIGPVLAVLVFTVAGVTRPGYSPVRQAISDLGTRHGGWLVDAVAVAMGLGLIGFAVSFTVLMRPVLSAGVRWFAAVCIALDGLGVVTAGVFTAAPATVALHTVGSSLGVVTTVIAFAVVGIALRRKDSWRRWGVYSLTAAVVALALVAVEYAFLMPRSPLYGLPVGGAFERADFLWHYAWYVVFGWRLFREVPRLSTPAPATTRA